MARRDGRGRALIKLAQTFPKSRFHGFDIVDAQLSKAITNATNADLNDKIRFQNVSEGDGLQGPYDIVTTFDVIHDADLLRLCDDPRCHQGRHQRLDQDRHF